MSKLLPFLEPGQTAASRQLAIALLARDSFQPVFLEESAGAVDGYAEGAVLNTRFGSFPHSTLIGVPWGSQVRASAVDTGSRGRKRKLEDTEEETSTPNPEDTGTSTGTKTAVQAASGFIHILRPSPELWTSSLPHRTQVVYTPDYSYILHRIRARPGTRIIEAGAGSGSFTHASVRAVYNGPSQASKRTNGKVFSFEFHGPRFEKMADEITNHGLQDLVHITHRDVYQDGFLVNGESPQATAIFLDLPAPWEALRHLSRRKLHKNEEQVHSGEEVWVSPLDPKQAAYICTFSPCIEQVIRTVAELRKQGWTDLDMVEISNKRLNVLRERVGINLPNERGYNQSPVDVAEAVTKLRQINKKTEQFNRGREARRAGETLEAMDIDEAERNEPNSGEDSVEDEEKAWLRGRLVHRPEAELKTHTSYLVFAVLPPEWSDGDEAAAMAKWPCGKELKTIGKIDKEVRRRDMREMLEMKKKQKGQQRQTHGAGDRES